ncbi:DNA methyltransferase [Priestia aryabhattai]
MSQLQIKAMFYNDSNKAQDYHTHSMFRYFGKLPPTLTKKIIDYNLEEGKGKILELMCGSGTTLLESYLSGRSSIGVDVNPLSVLISRVKTTYLDEDILKGLIEKVKTFLNNNEVNSSYKKYFRPKTHNLDYWFTQDIQDKLSIIKYMIDYPETYLSKDSLEMEDDLKSLLLVTFASIIRKCSNASPKTGRIFRMSEDNTVNPFELMIKRLEINAQAVANLPKDGLKPEVYLRDARDTELEKNQFDLIINHPPYFALYKYSSDVMRFELEWCDFNRKEISSKEIEDGFKTTKAELLDVYVKDMTDVFKEARRLLKKNGKLCVVVSDSTLREEQLPVVESLIKGAESINLRLHEHFIREVSFTQASYHKSANPNIKTNEDHVLYFTK